MADAKYQSTRDIAKMLGRSPRTVISWARQGRIPALPVPGRDRSTYLFDREAVLRVLAEEAGDE